MAYAIAWHAKSHGLIHHSQHLTEEESWKLLCEKVFQGDDCPKWMIEPGKKIAKNCHGLPLSVVVMAGVLAKEPRSKGLWLQTSRSVRSYIAGNNSIKLPPSAFSLERVLSLSGRVSRRHPDLFTRVALVMDS
uniref:NB-ARC domain-containing protein n=1 Tax=Lactuca sativa TaxID=4236 RepID=A0A9R1UT39_LACSA|nr:hypothetical protein LSAT_V11C800437750 [Lactuca sativa]